MHLIIQNIILYPVDKELQPRFINFKEGFVNIITGYSKRGKSSIIEIIDYCLGNSEPNIPIGKIRNLVDKFAIKVKINGQEIFIARDSPGKEGHSSDNMYYIEIEEKGEYSQLNSNAWIKDAYLYKEIRDQVINILNSKAGLKNIEQGGNEDDKGITISFRSTSSFLFQPQNLIANGNTIFYKTDSFYNIDRLKKFFPLALGYKSFEMLVLTDEIQDLEKAEKHLLNKIEDLQERYSNWKSELYEFYTEALKLGLTNTDIDLQSGKIHLIREQLEDIIKDIRNNNLLKKGSTITFSNKIAELENQRVILNRKLQELKMELNKILKFEITKDNYLNTVSTEIQTRLNPVDWFLQQKGTDICPFCNSTSEKALNQLQRLKEIKSQNNILLEQKRSNQLSFEKEKGALKKAIQVEETKIQEFDRNISILAKEKEKEHNIYQRTYEFAGKVSNFLKNLNLPDSRYNVQLKTIQSKLTTKRRELRRLKAKYDKDHTLSKVSDYIKFYIDQLPIENKEFCRVELDPDKHLNIKVRDEANHTLTFLNKIGSGSNYMCYHLATLLGLHDYFYHLSGLGKTSYIPTFIVLDQPSQVYYPENFEDLQKKNKMEVSEDFQNTKNIFEVCSKFNERTNGEVQIIILEHAPKETWNDIENIHLVEEWRGKEVSDKKFNALIPGNWLM